MNKCLGFALLAISLMSPFRNLNAQDASNLTLLSRWARPGLDVRDEQTYNDIWAWVDSSGNEYAIMGSLDSIYFFDVSKPEKPVVCDVEAGKSRYVVHRDFKTYSHYAYAHGDEGEASLQIFDLQYLPDSVHKVFDSDTFCYRAHNLFIDGDRLYLGSISTWKHGLIPMRVLSLKNPEKPEFLCDLKAPVVDGSPLFTESHDMFARNDTVYCSLGNAGLYIYRLIETDGDFSLKLIPGAMITRYPDAGYNHSSWLSRNGTRLVMADEDPGARLKWIDVSDPGAMEVLATFGVKNEEGSVPHNPFILGNYVFISYYHEGVQVFDLSFDQPKRVAWYDTYEPQTPYANMAGCWGVYPFLPSGIVVASDQLNGLHVFSFDVGMEENPRRAGLNAGSVLLRSSQLIMRLPDAGGINAPADYELYDMNGRQLRAGKTRVESGEINLNLPYERMSDGSYLMLLRTKESTFRLHLWRF